MTNFIVKVLQRTQLSHSESDVKHFIYIYSKWLEDVTELEFLCTTSNSSYRATLKHDEIRGAAEELEQPYEDFFEECKKVLSTQMGLAGFDYELSEQDARFKFYKCTGFETLYLDIPLRKVSNCYQLLDAAVNSAQQAHPPDAVQSTNQADGQYKELLTEYEQYIKDSKATERKLLKKFLLLLNSKKERIDELERKLGERSAETDTDEEERPAKNKRRVIDDEEEDYSGDTQAMEEDS